MNKKTVLVLAGIAALLLFKNRGVVAPPPPRPGAPGSSAPYRKALLDWASTSSADIGGPNLVYALSVMTDQEIYDTYSYIFDYIMKGTRPAPSLPVYQAIQLISAKYQIFS